MRDRASQWFWCVLVTAGFFLPWLPAVVADDLIRDLAEGFPRTWPAAARVPPVAGLAGAACLLLGLALLVLVLPAAERAASSLRTYQVALSSVADVQERIAPPRLPEEAEVRRRARAWSTYGAAVAYASSPTALDLRPLKV